MNRIFKKVFFTLCLCLLTGCASRKDFVSVKDGQFIREGKPYYYIGTNFWYGPILASEGSGGNYGRLVKELDLLKSLGLTNLRVAVGGDGPDGMPSRIEPTLQKEPGVYNDTLLAGLDRFLAELGKRDMTAVLYLNNSWEWTGGYGMYLEWAGAGKALIPAESGYGPYMQQMSQFATNRRAQELFFNHVRYIVSRRNTVTGKLYRDDPAIFSWQIGNEPRCFSIAPEVQEAFVSWIAEAAGIVRSIDRNHLISTGSEGAWGCEGSFELFERIHSCPDIDYLTIHIWPYNWGWVRENTLSENLQTAIDSIAWYIDRHQAIGEKLRKPVVIEEFGYPRDGFSFSKDTSTAARDACYKYIFGRVRDARKSGCVISGANFWGWGGFAEPLHARWRRGDDYTGDPAQEPQGLNSVFAGDSSTAAAIKEATMELQSY